MRLLTPLRRTLEMIKFEHSVFALPFALLGALLAARGWPAWPVVGWIVVAMVGARSAAMTFNRLVDRRIDAANPRTRNRALAAGTLSPGFAWGFFLASSAVFFLAAWRLNPLCLKLSPAALGWVLFYSATKRFTWLSHWVLGVGLGIAPAAAWIAVRGSLDPVILLLTAAVALWVAGFDLLYACQDVAFDASRPDLYSVPKKLGIARTLRLAQVCHVAMLGLLAWLLVASRLGTFGWIGLLVAAGLLVYEHSLLAPDDLSRMNAAFFTVNGYIGILLLVFWGAAILGAQTPHRPGLVFTEETPALPAVELRHIAGQAKDRAGNAVPSVLLGVFTEAEPHRLVAVATTDQDGKFNFDKQVPAGDYRLIAQYPGLCTMSLPVRVRARGPGHKLEIRMEYPGLDVCSYALPR